MKSLNKFNISKKRENSYNSIKPMATPLTKRVKKNSSLLNFLKDFSYVVEISCKICSRLRLTPSTQFLALFLAKNYLSYSTSEIKNLDSKQHASIVVHSSILIAAKMRERDVFCPLIPDILVAGGKILNLRFLEFQVEETEIKKMEIKICQFFDWSVSMMTFYDYIEEFLCRGVIHYKDTVKVPKSFTASPIRQNVFKNKEEQFKSPPTNKKRIEAMIWESNNKPIEKEEEFIEKKIGEFTIEDIQQTTDFIERRCFDLCQQVSYQFLTDANIQNEIAFMMLSVARKEANLQNQTDLTKIFGVEIRNKKLFNHFVEILSFACPTNAMNIKFDLVFRIYDKEGMELIPPQLAQQVHMNRDFMAKMVMSNSKYRDKMIKLGRIDPRLVNLVGPRDSVLEKRAIMLDGIETCDSERTVHQSPGEFEYPQIRKRPQRVQVFDRKNRPSVDSQRNLIENNDTDRTIKQVEDNIDFSKIFS